MRAVWWPESSAEEHAQELGFILSGKFPAVMPAGDFCIDGKQWDANRFY
jgi:hypothetical protein